MHCWEIPENRGQEDNKFKDRKKKEKWVSDIRAFNSNSDHLKKTEMGLQGSEEKWFPTQTFSLTARTEWGISAQTEGPATMTHKAVEDPKAQGGKGILAQGRGPTRQAAGWRLHRHCWCLSVSAPYVQFLSSDEKYLAYQQQTGQCYRQKKYQLWGGGSG